MSLTDELRLEDVPTNVTKSFISRYSATRDIAYWAIEDIKNTLIAAGWTVGSELFASGYVYAPGWFVNHGPVTTFINLPKGASPPDGFAARNIQTWNDQCKCEVDCGGETCFASFGTSQNECHNKCRNGCTGIGSYCPCGHTCCSEDADCNVTIDTTSPGCDATGDYCNGWFTGTFASFAKSVAGGKDSPCGAGCSNAWYNSSPADDGINVFVQALYGGPQYNSPITKTAIGVGFSSILPNLGINGGGYVMRSGINPTTGQQYNVSIWQNEKGTISLKVGTAEFRLTLLAGFGLVTPRYKIVANRCQFFIIDRENDDHSGSFSFGGNSFAVTSPWVKASTGVLDAVIAVGPGMLMDKCAYEGAVFSSVINGVQYTAPATIFGLRGLGNVQRNYSFAQPLVTSNDKKIISNAYLFAPVSDTDEARIVGKWWGGFMLSDSGVKNGIEFYNSRTMHLVSRQTTVTKCSLWIDGGTEV